MKTRGIRAAFLLFLSASLLAFSGCGKKEGKEVSSVATESSIIVTKSAIEVEDPSKSSEVPEVKEEEKPKEEVHRSFLTGEELDKKYKGKRPYTFMFNNIRVAYPQSESSKAGILYEILAEGGITRLMGIFDYMSGNKIGSCRSARHYFVDYAKEFDSFFIHFGQTKYAVSEIKKLGVDTLSGLSAEGYTVFFRDPHIPVPHNAFASTKGIKKAIKDKKYRTKINKNIGPHFNFSYEEEVDLSGKDGFKAEYVSVPFSGYMSPYFTYSKKTKLYTRYAFGTKHIDKANNTPLKFKNIFIQIVNEYNIDRNGYQTMDLIKQSGEGYYITNGKGIKVYWKKPDATSKTKFYYDKKYKEEVLVNTGKSYYAVFPKARKGNIKFKK